jgi:four helix bundle protein
MGHYRDLLAWQAAHELAVEVYRASASWADREKYGLTAQIRRAAFSIPANLAEGSRRTGSREFRRFVNIALGSHAELEYGLEFAEAVGLSSAEQRARLIPLLASVGRLTYRLVRSLG